MIPRKCFENLFRLSGGNDWNAQYIPLKLTIIDFSIGHFLARSGLFCTLSVRTLVRLTEPLRAFRFSEPLLDYFLGATGTGNYCYCNWWSLKGLLTHKRKFACFNIFLKTNPNIGTSYQLRCCRGHRYLGISILLSGIFGFSVKINKKLNKITIKVSFSGWTIPLTYLFL